MEHRHLVVSSALSLMVALSGCVAPSSPPAKTLVTVKLGHLDPASVSHAPLLIAQEMGFFAEQGIIVESVGFANSADTASPLSSNQLDVGQLGVNAGLFNAFNRGIKVVIAADAASSGPTLTTPRSWCASS
jgi:ABC-type nitrate/sulfonate/bicarbonate transport system substrate-binding protein